jgi:hypothetical protein
MQDILPGNAEDTTAILRIVANIKKDSNSSKYVYDEDSKPKLELDLSDLDDTDYLESIANKEHKMVEEELLLHTKATMVIVFACNIFSAQQTKDGVVKINALNQIVQSIAQKLKQRSGNAYDLQAEYLLGRSANVKHKGNAQAKIASLVVRGQAKILTQVQDQSTPKAQAPAATQIVGEQITAQIASNAPITTQTKLQPKLVTLKKKPEKKAPGLLKSVSNSARGALSRLFGSK